MMMNIKFVGFILTMLSILFFVTCIKDPNITTSHFPKEIQAILVNKCATAGCHNDNSFQNAAGLNLTTWDKLFEGGNAGASVIPYSADYSSLFQFINTDSALGPIAKPTMPYNANPLSVEEIKTIKDWINAGAPNDKEEIAFSSQANTRQKIYVSNQGCDVVSVLDAKTKMVMRMIPVGHTPLIEVPHCIRVSPDKKYWYVCFTEGNYFQKYSAVTDKLVAEVDLGSGLWNIIKLSPDSKIAYISDLSNDGKIVKVNTETMQLIATYQGVGLFSFPHGIAFAKNYDTVYVTAQYGNMIYRIIPALLDVKAISIQKGVAPSTASGLLDPHEIIFSPDYKKYFVSCQFSNEVRVLDAITDTLIQIIPVGSRPEELAVYAKKNELYVTCADDVNTTYPNSKGSIYAIDINTLQIVKKIEEKFYQPHGIAIHNELGYMYIASRNVLTTGPPPHHTSVCGGRNGYLTILDLHTWKLQKPNNELSVDPYSIDTR